MFMLESILKENGIRPIVLGKKMEELTNGDFESKRIYPFLKNSSFNTETMSIVFKALLSLTGNVYTLNDLFVIDQSREVVFSELSALGYSASLKSTKELALSEVKKFISQKYYGPSADYLNHFLELMVGLYENIHNDISLKGLEHLVANHSQFSGVHIEYVLLVYGTFLKVLRSKSDFNKHKEHVSLFETLYVENNATIKNEILQFYLGSRLSTEKAWKIVYSDNFKWITSAKVLVIAFLKDSQGITLPRRLLLENVVDYFELSSKTWLLQFNKDNYAKWATTLIKDVSLNKGNIDLVCRIYNVVCNLLIELESNVLFIQSDKAISRYDFSVLLSNVDSVARKTKETGLTDLASSLATKYATLKILDRKNATTKIVINPPEGTDQLISLTFFVQQKRMGLKPKSIPLLDKDYSELLNPKLDVVSAVRMALYEVELNVLLGNKSKANQLYLDLLKEVERFTVKLENVHMMILHNNLAHYYYHLLARYFESGQMIHDTEITLLCRQVIANYAGVSGELSEALKENWVAHELYLEALEK